MTRVAGDVDALTALPNRSTAGLPTVRAAAHRLDDALRRVAVGTDPGFRPAAVGDGQDALVWVRGVETLDGWVAEVGRRLGAADATGAAHLAFQLTLALTMPDPRLPPLRSATGGGDGRDGRPPHPDVADFDEIADELDDHALLAWWQRLRPAQRERIGRARWPALAASPWLPDSDRAQVLSWVREDLPVRTTEEDVGYRLGIGPVAFGTDYTVTQVVEHDGDVLVTIGFSDSLAAQLPERWIAGTEATAGGAAGSSTTLRFTDVEEAASAVADLAEVFVPGASYDSDMSLLQHIGFLLEQAARGGVPDSAAALELEMSMKLAEYGDRVVERSDVRQVELSAEVADALDVAGSGTWVRDRATGNVSFTRQIAGDADVPVPVQGVTLPDGALRGDIEGHLAETTTVDPDGQLVATTTTAVLSADGGRLEADLGALSAGAGVEIGRSVSYTFTTTADGHDLRTLTVTDNETTGGRLGVDLSRLDPRLPRFELSGNATDSEVSSIWMRRDDGSGWVEVTP